MKEILQWYPVLGKKINKIKRNELFLFFIHRLFIPSHEIYYINTTTAFNYFRQTITIDRLEINKSFLYQFYFYRCHSFNQAIPANIYLFKVNNRNTRKRCEICSKLTIKTPERRRFGVFFANFEHISHFFLVFLLLTLNK